MGQRIDKEELVDIVDWANMLTIDPRRGVLRLVEEIDSLNEELELERAKVKLWQDQAGLWKTLANGWRKLSEQ